MIRKAGSFYCDVIMDEASKMNLMVKNLLTLNQLEFGNDEVIFERFDVSKLIQGVIQSCEILIQQADAKIDLSVRVRFMCGQMSSKQSR